MATTVDLQIPCISWMVLIYWGCYFFWAANYILGVKYDKGQGSQFIGAHFVGEIICFFCFILFPTTMIRQENLGPGIWDQLLAWTYLYDDADNLFPSIHCFVSWLCWIGVRKNEFMPKWYQRLSLVFAIMVCVSTLTVKQHVIADVVSGILLAEISYCVAGVLERTYLRKRNKVVL